VSDAEAGSTEQRSASGGLFGGLSLINVGGGTDYTEDAVALQRFNRGPLYQPSGSVSPQLTDSSPKVSVVFAAEPNPAKIFNQRTDLGVYASQWPTPLYFAADTVSAVLMHDRVMNEYVLDAGSKAISRDFGTPLIKDRLHFFTSYAPDMGRTERTIPFAAGTRTTTQRVIRHYGIARVDYAPSQKMQRYGWAASADGRM